MIGHLDIGVKNVGIAFVEIDALLDDSLIIRVQRDARRAVGHGSNRMAILGSCGGRRTDKFVSASLLEGFVPASLLISVARLIRHSDR